MWVVRGNLGGAAQMALALLALIALLVVFERHQRKARHFHTARPRGRPLPRFHLRGARGAAAAVACALPVMLGFVVPVTLFASHAGNPTPALLEAAGNSLALAGAAGLAVAALALLLAYAARTDRRPLTRWSVQIATLGYAIPGSILAIGVLAVVAADGVPLLSGTLAALFFAYIVRFMAPGFGVVNAGLERVPATMDAAARSLGAGRGATLARVHIRMIPAPLLAGALLVFVDVMKELPATLILRPFDFETLASLVYMHASLGQLEDAALPALGIIVTGLLPVVLTLTLFDRQRRTIVQPHHSAA